MKHTTIKSFLLLILATFIVSCSDDDEKNPPVISNLEVGYDNSLTGYIGSDLHLDAEIYAEAKIAGIRVTIHPEGEHEETGENSGTEEGEWEVDTTYTEGYAGVINADFHEHIDIPGDASPGDYHFHLTVTDMDGYQTTTEQDFQIAEGEDPGHEDDDEH